MDVHAQPRISKRMPCAVNIGARRYSGMVLNLSQGGLFVQTNADPGRGESVVLELNAPGQAETIPLRATVVWRRIVPARLRSIAQGGVGVRIQHADETYFQLLARWMRPSAAPLNLSSGQPAPAVAPRRSVPSFRVRVRATASPRTRTLTVEAQTPEAARAVALGYAGDGWRIIDVEPL